jgi:probable HAF family extracellular repeat protein
MSHWKSFGLATFAVVCLLGEATGSAFAQCSPGAMCATEWSNGQAIFLPSLPGTVSSEANGINNPGRWWDTAVSALGAMSPPSGATARSSLPFLPGSAYSQATGINDAGQVVGFSFANGVEVPTEWSNGQVISLPFLPGFTFAGRALGINDAGQVVGFNQNAPGSGAATEWSNGQVINLVGLTGSTFSQAAGINDAGQVVGFSDVVANRVPEPSTWAMMLIGFAGLGYAGYRQSKRARP